MVIELVPGLDRHQHERAFEAGPTSMTSDGALEDLSREAGLIPLSVEDWTSDLGETLERSLEELLVQESELRTGEGDDIFEHEVSKKRRMLEGVRAGLLRRTLVVAAAP